MLRWLVAGFSVVAMTRSKSWRSNIKRRWLLQRVRRRDDMAALGRMLISSDSWFHVTRRGGFFALHNHPNASWSGVYCVDPGKNDADTSSEK